MQIIKFRQAIFSQGKFNSWHYWGFLPDISFAEPNTSQGIASALANSQQFTGLRDKKRTKEYPKGQEVYKTDIIKVQDGNYTAKGIVEYDDKKGMWVWLAIKTTFTITKDKTIPLWKVLHIQYRYKGEVIGNTYKDKNLY